MQGGTPDQIAFLTRLFEGTPSADDVDAILDRYVAFGADAVSRVMEKRAIQFDRVEIANRLRKDAWDVMEIAGFPQLVGLLPVTHPELILPSGFDEVRYSAPDVSDPTLSESVFGLRDQWYEEFERGEKGPGVLLAGSTQYRSRDGLWHDYFGVIDHLLPPQAEPGEGERRSNSEWWSLLQENWIAALQTPGSGGDTSIVLPSLYLPSRDDSLLHAASRSILHEIAAAKISLADIHWRTLEELVAELLRSMGLAVHITPRANDGGRDVIARGELIPGEPTILAVEVKHKDVVPVSDVRAALWANRNYPALLFVTSGRLSAGVYRERAASVNQLRLLLKDGKALRQWIDQYVARQPPQ